MPERNIDTSIHTDPKYLALGPVARALFKQVICSSQSHALGIYHLPLYVLDHEFGFPQADTLAAMVELSRAGRVHYDLERQVVWAVNMGERQARSIVCWRGVRHHLASLHGSPLIAGFVVRYKDKTVGKDGLRPVDESMATLAEPLPNGSPTPHEWLTPKGWATLAQWLATLAEPLLKGTKGSATLANPPGTGPGPGTGSGESLDPDRSEIPSPESLSHAGAPARVAEVVPIGKWTGDEQRAAFWIWNEFVTGRSALIAEGITDGGGAQLSAIIGADGLEGRGLLPAVRAFGAAEVKRALPVALAEARKARTLRWLDGKVTWSAGCLAYWLSHTPESVPAQRRAGGDAPRFHQHTEADAYEKGVQNP